MCKSLSRGHTVLFCVGRGGEYRWVCTGSWHGGLQALAGGSVHFLISGDELDRVGVFVPGSLAC